MSETHPLFAEFAEITKEGEQAGMYDDGSIIGYSQTWEFLMEQRGYTLVDGRLFRDSSFSESTIERGRTAISRYHLYALPDTKKTDCSIPNQITWITDAVVVTISPF